MNGVLSLQTNPCQHPVIILQDVHFTELEALLIFIYKGEVNIDQKNLPALLKAAETLQIRGLSGGDIFAKESNKRLIESEGSAEDDDSSIAQEIEQISKKKRKVVKSPNNSILEKALMPQTVQTVDETSSRDEEISTRNVDTVPNPVYHRLQMKVCSFFFIRSEYFNKSSLP